jgi:Na+-driven multidrug efflux pump
MLYLVGFLSHRFILEVNSFNPKFDFPTIRRILRLGIPTAMQRLVMSLASIAYIAIIIRFGTVAVAANQLELTVESLSYMPGFGFAVAATTLVGQNLEADNPEDAEKHTWESVKMCSCFMGVIGLL